MSTVEDVKCDATWNAKKLVDGKIIILMNAVALLRVAELREFSD